MPPLAPPSDFQQVATPLQHLPSTAGGSLSAPAAATPIAAAANSNEAVNVDIEASVPGESQLVFSGGQIKTAAVAVAAANALKPLNLLSELNIPGSSQHVVKSCMPRARRPPPCVKRYEEINIYLDSVSFEACV